MELEPTVGARIVAQTCGVRLEELRADVRRPLDGVEERVKLGERAARRTGGRLGHIGMARGVLGELLSGWC